MRVIIGGGLVDLPRSGYLSIGENIMRGPGRETATSPIGGNQDAGNVRAS
jgi:hypothetical protein